MAIVSSTDGSPTKTGWNRRSRAASFSMYLRYSSSVVAPMQRSSPRARAGLSRLAASLPPSAAPAPTTVCSSSMNRITCPPASSTSREHRLESLLELAAELGAGDQRAHVERDHPLVLQALRHVALRRSAARAPRRWPSCRRPARRSAPGCSCVRRERTWITRRISWSRPITGSSLPCLARSTRSMPYFSSAWNFPSGFWSVTRLRAADLLQAP